MKRFVLCTVLLLLWTSSALGAEVREAFYSVGADVDAQGQISATRFDADVPAPISEVIVSAMKQWRFSPATSNGQPVPARTFIRVKVQTSPDESTPNQLLIIFAGNGPRLGREPAPVFPKKGIQSGESGFLLLEATAQPDGRLTDMSVSTRFEVWPMRLWYRKALLSAAQHWRAQPEEVNGIPVATRLRIPVNFILNGSDVSPRQLEALREADRQSAAADASTGIPRPSEQEVALDSPLRPSAVATVTSAP